jgi:ligand-binding SRPBCC domain-containing protein
MPEIILHTAIDAPLERTFFLSTSIDLHKDCTAHTEEEAIGGRTSGLLKLNETVTWRAKHFGITQELTSKMIAYEFPKMFVDEMQKGIFKKLYHTHTFSFENGRTLMKDNFIFEAPLGIVRKLAEILFLENYLRKFLIQRNTFLKKVAEGNDWGKYLEDGHERLD